MTSKAMVDALANGTTDPTVWEKLSAGESDASQVREPDTEGRPRPVGRFEWERELRQRSGISWTLRGVLLTLATFSTTKTGDDMKPSLSDLAKAVGCSRSTVTKYAGQGVAQGWLELVEDHSRDGMPNTYRLTIPPRG